MKPPTYRHTITVPLQDVDAAGRVFFAHLFRYAHETYEGFMSERGQSLAGILRAGEYLLPLVHAEADYLLPLGHGESITIELSIKRVGDTSFTLAYQCLDSGGTLRATVETVHVVLDSVTERPLQIPPALGRVLTA